MLIFKASERRTRMGTKGIKSERVNIRCSRSFPRCVMFFPSALVISPALPLSRNSAYSLYSPGSVGTEPFGAISTNCQRVFPATRHSTVSVVVFLSSPRLSMRAAMSEFQFAYSRGTTYSRDL